MHALTEHILKWMLVSSYTMRVIVHNAIWVLSPTFDQPSECGLPGPREPCGRDEGSCKVQCVRTTSGASSTQV